MEFVIKKKVTNRDSIYITESSNGRLLINKNLRKALVFYNREYAEKILDEFIEHDNSYEGDKGKGWYIQELNEEMKQIIEGELKSINMYVNSEAYKIFMFNIEFSGMKGPEVFEDAMSFYKQILIDKKK